MPIDIKKSKLEIPKNTKPDFAGEFKIKSNKKDDKSEDKPVSKFDSLYTNTKKFISKLSILKSPKAFISFIITLILIHGTTDTLRKLVAITRNGNSGSADFALLISQLMSKNYDDIVINEGVLDKLYVILKPYLVKFYKNFIGDLEDNLNKSEEEKLKLYNEVTDWLLSNNLPDRQKIQSFIKDAINNPTDVEKNKIAVLLSTMIYKNIKM